MSRGLRAGAAAAVLAGAAAATALVAAPAARPLHAATSSARPHAGAPAATSSARPHAGAPAVASSARPHAGAPAVATARALPGAPNCRFFPRDNAWNVRVDRLRRHRRSARIVAAVGADAGLKADFGSGLYEGAPIGIPFTVVGGAQRRVPVSFDYDDESDPGPYPIPPDAPVEGGGDRHVLVVDRDACRLYELYAAQRHDGGARWSAGSGAIFDLRSNRLRPRGWTSADAAGLPILPGLARYDEVEAGRIDHALRVTVPRTRRAFVYPARHYASTLTDPDLPPMGLRLRLRRGFSTRGFPRQARVVLEALKRYGMMVADNGSAWFITGAPDPGWDNDALRALGRVHGRDLEVVDPRAIPRP